MYESDRALSLVAVIAMALAFFSLLALRADHVLDISHYLVGIPVYVFAGLGILYFFYFAVFKDDRPIQDRFYAMGFVVLLLGFLWMYLLFAAKFEADIEITYWFAVLPFLVTSVMALFIDGTGMLASYLDRKTSK